MVKYYTGVGSRKTPPDILVLMGKIASRLAELGYVLRSGGAIGADQAFQAGAGDRCEIFVAQDATPDAVALAAKFHPAWDRCGDYAKKLHGRNSFQVLGRGLDSSSKFLVCWTPDGATTHAERSYATGGTGTAISIASENGVPVFNLCLKAHLDRLLKFIGAG